MISKQLARFFDGIILRVMDMEVDEDEMSSAKDIHERGSKVELLLAKIFLEELNCEGFKATLIYQPKNPKEFLVDPFVDPAVLITDRLFGSGKTVSRDILMNQPGGILFPEGMSCPPTVVAQPFGGTQGTLDFLLLIEGRCILVSVKGWSGSPQIKQNSAMSHSGVLYICVRNNKPLRGQPNFVYLGADLEKDLSQQRRISKEQSLASAAIQAYHNPQPLVSTHHRNDRLVEVHRLVPYLEARHGSLLNAGRQSIEMAWSGDWSVSENLLLSDIQSKISADLAMLCSTMNLLDVSIPNQAHLYENYEAHLKCIEDFQLQVKP